MKIKFIFFVIPVPVFYTKSDLEGFAGMSYGFFIRIQDKYKDDRGLLEAELQHCRQFYRMFGLSGILYKLSKKYRYKMEFEAYRVQLGYVSDQNKESAKRRFAISIVTLYNLDVGFEKVLRDLSE